VSYENPQQPEGINVSDEHPVRELFTLLAAVTVAAVAFVVFLSTIASALAQYVPFAMEQRLASIIGVERMFESDDDPQSPLRAQTEEHKLFVEQLCDALIKQADLKDGVEVRLHYHPGDTVNAYASLGGHIVMYEGLVAKLPNENALAMVLAHEIGHIKLRHPIVAMSRGLTVAIALGSIFGMTDNAFISRLVEWIGYSSTLSYSREQEREADAFAADLLVDYYGHLRGAEDLFVAFGFAAAESDDKIKLPMAEFLSTHPGLAERTEALRLRAERLGATGMPRLLPWQVVDE
jgi:Zn-dependent protease with chaperone function